MSAAFYKMPRKLHFAWKKSTPQLSAFGLIVSTVGLLTAILAINNFCNVKISKDGSKFLTPFTSQTFSAGSQPNSLYSNK